ncbi:MAG: hypothetical protein ABIZ56_01060 [Chthoniobacteraceae bacterium]
MARVNYAGEKRRKELEKQRKKEEKRQRKLSGTPENENEDGEQIEGESAVDAGESPAVTPPADSRDL